MTFLFVLTGTKSLKKFLCNAVTALQLVQVKGYDMSINESIIRSVFDAMVAYKPKLANYLPSDDDGRDFDIRELADQIVKNFPLPIGVELRRLFAAGMERPDRGRLDQIFKTIERAMQFTSFVMLSQALEETIAKNYRPTDDFTKEFSRRFAMLTMGNFAWLVRTIGAIFTENRITPFLPEMTHIFQDGFYKKLDFWAPERNDIGHYIINLTDEEIQSRCYEYQRKLTDILSNLAFFTKYPLVTITDIRVLKTKRKRVIYNHAIKPLRAVSTNIQEEENCDAYADNHSVLLLKSLKNPPDAYLNLSPLIIDTYPEVLNTPEKIRNVRKDIFLFTKWQNERLHYLGTEVTEKCDLRSLSCYDQLVEECKEYLHFFGSP